MAGSDDLAVDVKKEKQKDGSTLFKITRSNATSWWTKGEIESLYSKLEKVLFKE